MGNEKIISSLKLIKQRTNEGAQAVRDARDDAIPLIKHNPQAYGLLTRGVQQYNEDCRDFKLEVDKVIDLYIPHPIKRLPLDLSFPKLKIDDRHIGLCFMAGASSVVVTDHQINDPPSCFTLTGLAQAAESVGASILLPKDDFFKPTTVSGARLIKKWPLLYGPFMGISKVIGIAPVKDHQRSGASMTMKNWYGLLGGRRNIFHQDIHNTIKELALMVTPTLVILDGTTTMMTNGPTGGSLADLRKTNTMIVSTDQVAADAFGATLLGKTLPQLPYISKAEASGVGTADYVSLNPVRVSTG